MEKKHYILMWRDHPVTAISFDDSGRIIHFSKDYEKDLMPLEEMKDPGRSLKKWWENRAVPVSQGKIKHMLEQRGNMLPSMYLKENLGLSLSDYYWIKPIDSPLRWKDVSLFSNMFVDDLNLIRHDITEGTPNYTPNSSLQGQLEKAWTIINDERTLIKGNHGETSAESINEVIAAEIHRLQGTHAFADYRLIHIKDKEYDYGCMTKSFTSESYEFISAYALYSSENKPSDISGYRHLLNVCEKHGMNVDSVREGLEYQIMTDYIISGYDRHLNNIGFLRSADTMKFTGLCPIYDSGGSLFAGQRLPVSVKDLNNINTTGIGKTERHKLKFVTNPDVVDLTKLPPVSFIRELYEKDTKTEKRVVDTICWAYEKKIDMCRELQLGVKKGMQIPVRKQIPEETKTKIIQLCDIIQNDYSAVSQDNLSFEAMMKQANTRVENVKTARKELEKIIDALVSEGFSVKNDMTLPEDQVKIIEKVMNKADQLKER